MHPRGKVTEVFIAQNVFKFYRALHYSLMEQNMLGRFYLGADLILSNFQVHSIHGQSVNMLGKQCQFRILCSWQESENPKYNAASCPKNQLQPRRLGMKKKCHLHDQHLTDFKKNVKRDVFLVIRGKVLSYNF